jgi:hypothetical protein
MNGAPFRKQETANRHVVDELADIREAIRRLEEREGELRAYILDHPHDRVGDDHIAAVVNSDRHQRLASEAVDLEGLAAAVGEAAIARFTHRKPVTTVRVRRRAA